MHSVRGAGRRADPITASPCPCPYLYPSPFLCPFRPSSPCPCHRSGRQMGHSRPNRRPCFSLYPYPSCPCPCHEGVAAHTNHRRSPFPFPCLSPCLFLFLCLFLCP